MLHIAALNYAFVYRQVAVRGYDKLDGKGTTFMGIGTRISPNRHNKHTSNYHNLLVGTDSHKKAI